MARLRLPSATAVLLGLIVLRVILLACSREPASGLRIVQRVGSQQSGLTPFQPLVDSFSVPITESPFFEEEMPLLSPESAASK